MNSDEDVSFPESLSFSGESFPGSRPVFYRTFSGDSPVCASTPTGSPRVELRPGGMTVTWNPEQGEPIGVEVYEVDAAALNRGVARDLPLIALPNSRSWARRMLDALARRAAVRHLGLQARRQRP